MQHATLAAAVERHGLELIADRIESLWLEFDLLEPVDCVGRAVDLCERIPRPARVIERMCLAALLLNVAVRLSAHLHRSAELNRVCACQGVVARAAAAFVTPPLEPQATFVAWLEQFTSAYGREHPPTPATRVAALIRAAPARHWMVDELAAEVGSHPRRLRRLFRATFGLSIRQYLETSRVAAVFAELCDRRCKVSAVADNAGYRSPKDFYRAVRNSLRRTPGSLRALPDADKADVRRLLEATLAGRSRLPDNATIQPRGQLNSLRLKPLKATLRTRSARAESGMRNPSRV